MKNVSTPVAVEIKDGKVTTWDGKTETHADLKVDSPCGASFMIPKSGGEEGNTYTLVMDHGTPRFGLGDGGEKVGKGAVVCAGIHLYVLDDAGACTDWGHIFRWESKPATCALAGGAFTYKDDFGEHSVPVRGELIEDDQLVEDGARRAPDFATAKKQVDDAFAATDPGTIARAAGGKVGDTSTIAGLIATYGADPKTLIGQRVTTRAVFGNAGSSNGQAYAILRVDLDEAHELLTVTCRTASEPSLASGAPVEATGTVADSGFDKPELTGCTVTAK
jgi:hypothetical protein